MFSFLWEGERVAVSHACFKQQLFGVISGKLDAEKFSGGKIMGGIRYIAASFICMAPFSLSNYHHTFYVCDASKCHLIQLT